MSKNKDEKPEQILMRNYDINKRINLEVKNNL